jgi:hypothetical protein
MILLADMWMANDVFCLVDKLPSKQNWFWIFMISNCWRMEDVPRGTSGIFDSCPGINILVTRATVRR